MMTRVTCAISGIRFECSYFSNLNIPHTEGYFHPIFAAPYKHLHHLYSAHCTGRLTSNDSYLLFCAFLHSSGAVHWKHPAACNPNDISTKRLVDANLEQLIEVLERSACIKFPGFKQPHFSVNLMSSDLSTVPHWIKAWQRNINIFLTGRSDMSTQEAIQKVENRLSKLILSGEKPERMSHIIADWACKVAEFPPHQEEEWKRIIRSSYSTNKMFNTPIAALREIKEYCELNIEAGSIHFHTLCTILKTGINNHTSYLGAANTSDLGYTLIPIDIGKIDKNTAEIIALADSAPESEPVESDYSSSLAFLQAKLAYRVAASVVRQQKPSSSPSSNSDSSLTAEKGKNDDDR